MSHVLFLSGKHNGTFYFYAKYIILKKRLINDTLLSIQVCKLASDYAQSCTCPDENRNSEASFSPGCLMLSDRCDVYVWGSNSSHQLAVGSQEKVLQPKASTAFTDVQQV